jgi:hypothetical protein
VETFPTWFDGGLELIGTHATQMAVSARAHGPRTRSQCQRIQQTRYLSISDEYRSGYHRSRRRMEAPEDVEPLRSVQLHYATNGCCDVGEQSAVF